MDITKTRSQVIHEAADKLSIVGTGQPLEDEYRDKLDGNLDPILSQLSRDDICHVGNDEAIPAEWFDPIAGLLANVCGPLGGRQYDPRIKEFYEMQLRRLTATSPSYEIAGADYF